MTTSEDKGPAALPEDGPAVAESPSECQRPAEDSLQRDASLSWSDEADEAQEGDEEQPPMITLDRYLSRRRPKVQMGWSQALSLLMMFSGLILILVYKDGCGERVSGLMHAVAPGADRERTSPTVRYELAPARGGGDAGASATKPDGATKSPTGPSRQRP